MKDGSRGDYGLRALVFLAAQSDGSKPLQIHAIATSQLIPEDYLRQLLVQLRSAGLVRSVRGPHGGYLLAREPDEISVAEVLEVLEGPPEQLHHNFERTNEGEPCQIIGSDQIRACWNQAIERMQAVLHGTSLAQLIDASKETEG